jgi:D-sedoheptulose 7-phosphate isomerase
MYKIYMSEIKRLENYLKVLSSKIIPNKEIFDKILKIKKLIMMSKKNKSKILVFGNGGSAAIASHFSVDLTKNAKVSAMNFNEADLITCFANDYGFENWISKTIEHYADKNDILILISSSGRSKNMINACKAAKKKRVLKIITFTGNKKNNPLSKLGDLNLWVDSNIYNHIENTHQTWLLSICDLIKLNKVR